MEFTKRAIWQMVLGMLAGLVSYLILLPCHSPWEEVIAAVVIGSVAGRICHQFHRVLLIGLICAAGWLVGATLFGMVLDLGIGAWILAGAALGAVVGLVSRSLWKVTLGLCLGLAAGTLAEISRFAALAVASLRGVDMQLLLLLSAGSLLGLISFLTVWSRRQAGSYER